MFFRKAITKVVIVLISFCLSVSKTLLSKIYSRNKNLLII